MTEEQSVIEAAKKDPAKFSLLYERYYQSMLRFVRVRMEDMNEAEDLVHQVFLKAMVNLGKFRHQGVPFASWLYRIALSEVNDHYRKSKKERVVHARTEQIYGMLEEIDEEMFSSQMQAMLRALEDLPSGDIQLIEMRFFEKMAFREIAEITGITENNAKVKLYRILDKVKKMVSRRY